MKKIIRFIFIITLIVSSLVLNACYDISDDCTEVGHKYISSVTAPTCTAKGFATYTCSECGHSYVDDYIDSIHHYYENGKCADCNAENPFLESEQLIADFDNVTGVTEGLSDCWTANMPFIYSDATMLENTKITEISLYVTKYKAGKSASTYELLNDDTTYTYNIHILAADSIGAGKAYLIKRTYTIEVLGRNVKKDAWNTFDVSHLDINVGEGETLGFGDEDSTLGTYYLNRSTYSSLCYYGRSGSSNKILSLRSSYNLLVGVSGYNVKKADLKANTETLKSKLSGKYLSVFGASMCTFDGYSNNANTNSTIGDNVRFYPDNGDVLRVEDTFWMQLISELNMNLLVNNSSSGSRVTAKVGNIEAAYIDRCRQLHADVGKNAGISPDVIVSFMGNNDYTAQATLGAVSEELFDTIENNLYNNDWRGSTYADCYAMMVARMRSEYPDAEIFLFNMAYNTKPYSGNRESYNSVINAIAEEYDCYIVDLTNSKMRGDSYKKYSSDELHPNAAGMDVWTNLIIEAMEECYLK